MWYGYGWWWWWLAFVVIFFLLPLGYGWGYRGWGPWYRSAPRALPDPDAGMQPGMTRTPPDSSGWGWLGVGLWIILIVAVVWGVTAWWWQ